MKMTTFSFHFHITFVQVNVESIQEVMALPEKIQLELIAERVQLERDVAQRLERIEKIKEMLSESIDWNKKIYHCLYELQEPLTTLDILKYSLRNRESELADKKKKEVYVKKISLHLHRQCANGVIFGEPIKKVKGKLYGLSAWKNNTGELFPEYSYKFERKIENIINEKNSFYRDSVY